MMKCHKSLTHLHLSILPPSTVLTTTADSSLDILNIIELDFHQLLQGNIFILFLTKLCYSLCAAQQHHHKPIGT